MFLLCLEPQLHEKKENEQRTPHQTADVVVPRDDDASPTQQASSGMCTSRACAWIGFERILIILSITTYYSRYYYLLLVYQETQLPEKSEDEQVIEPPTTGGLGARFTQQATGTCL